jgi:hypothetical protein
LQIPFRLNKAVSANNITGIQVLIKTITSNRILGTVTGSFAKAETHPDYDAVFQLPTTGTNAITLSPG